MSLLKNPWPHCIPSHTDLMVSLRLQMLRGQVKSYKQERALTLHSGLRTPHKHKDPTSEADSFRDFRYDLLNQRPLRFCRQQNFGRSLRGHGLEPLMVTLSRTT